MTTHLFRGLILAIALTSANMAFAQFDIKSQDPTAEGPWSDVALTTLTVPQVVDGSITIDGNTSDGEYGGFAGVTVTPGDNAWIHTFPGDRVWDGPEDSSFTFWLAHDTDFLYMGFNVADDVVNSDDPNGAFWKDDAIEIVTDVFNDNYDNNTDNSMDGYGGHAYVNYEGRFSGWDDEADVFNDDTRWSTDVDYTYGDAADDDIFGFGEEIEGGWAMEVRFAKRLFESEEVGNKLVEGERMGLNLIMDDDDKFGPGENGSAERSQDLEIQYTWANRLRAKGFTPEEAAEFYTEEELENELYLTDEAYDLVIDGVGRLSHGGAGEIIFGGLVEVSCDPNTQGDIDGSGTVDFADFLVLSGNFGQTVGSQAEGDIDCSGTVDFADFLDLSTNFGKTVGRAQSVPEPSAAFLCCFALLGLTRRRSRR